MAKPFRPSGRAAARGRGALGDSGGPEGDPPGRAAARRQGRGEHKGLKIAGLVTGLVVVVACAGGVYAYNTLNGNIKSDDLFAGKGGDQLHEKPDAFGRTPINILMIGSDARTSKADCAIGGACDGGQGGARADVEMIVHISADRSNATVLSIPRDLETEVPGCQDRENNTSGNDRVDMINSELTWGPGCSVAAIQQLTGIPIDHFMMVDFSGVVNMADAVGGVHICVNADVYDPYSHLKLKAGGHNLTGIAALEFLRTRHGFSNGTDVGRTLSQHLYLSSLISKLKTAGTLTDPAALWKLADAATKSLTVDQKLNSIARLTGLADDINKVPTDRITFTTMQTIPDPANIERVVIGPGASTLFRTIADDQSLTTASGNKSTAAAAATGIPTGGIAVQVENGTSVRGRALAIRKALVDGGFSPESKAVNGSPSATTTLTYPAGQQPEAKAVAKALGLKSSALKQGTGTQFVLLVGADWPSGTTFPGAKAVVDTTAALANANEHKASDSGCATVGTDNSLIPLDASGQPASSDRGYGSTNPTRAYAISRNVPDSAP